MKSLRASLGLLVLTAVICCGFYPAVLYSLGQAAFPARANGSLVGADGKAGSTLIAQPFSKGEYFWPRPSAASYNAAAAGGSNWGANNPKLRERVARQLGPMIVYKAGSPSAGTGSTPRTPQQAIEAWAAQQPVLPPVASDSSLAASVFDLWLNDPANAAKAADLEPVPADMVTASGSGLDPHITLRNALSVYQLDRVAKSRTATPAEFEQVRNAIADLTKQQAFTPLSGLVGEPLVNVLELNIALDAAFPLPSGR